MDGSDTIVARLARRVLEDHPDEAARLLERLNVEEAVETLLMVDAAQAAAVVRRMDRASATACVARWPGEHRAGLLATLDAGLAARLLRALGAAARADMLAACPERVAGPIRRLLSYPEDSAGALMDANPPAAPGDITVEAARELLGRWSSRTRGQLYVVSREGALVGVVEVDDLLHALPEATLGSLMRPASARLSARADRAAIAAHPGWKEHHMLPVVDRNEVLIGTIGHQVREPEDRGAEEPSLAFAMGEMYWTLLSSLVEGVVRSLRSGDASSAEVKQ
jgi:magnesium transporter